VILSIGIRAVLLLV
jgi:hypothetical protein